MPHSNSVEALVLKTYDVGEADRYCILFTKERGRLAARAMGVRKPKSRMGGSLLPLRRIKAELREGSAGWMVTGAEAFPEDGGIGDIRAFTVATEGVELLLRLTQDAEPLPEVYAAFVAFLAVSQEVRPRASLAFALQLLHLLGFLPGDEETETFFALSEDERVFVEAARQGSWEALPSLQDASRVELLRDRFLGDQLSGPLKAPGVSGAIQRGV